MLQDRWRLNTPFGERAFSILLFQDLSIVPPITIIAALSRAPVDPAAPPGWQLAIHTVLAVAGLVLAGRFVMNPLFRLIGRIGRSEEHTSELQSLLRIAFSVFILNNTKP